MSTFKLTWLSILLELTALLGLIANMVLILVSIRLLPTYFLVHFDLSGEGNMYGTTNDLILLFVLSLSFFVGLSLLQRIPHKFNYPWQITKANQVRQFELARKFIQIIKTESVWIFTIIGYQIMVASLADHSSLSYFVVPTIILVTSGTIVTYLFVALRER